jgi:hypothetical protein
MQYIMTFFLMAIGSTLLARKKMFVVIASLAIVAAYMMPYDTISEAFAARGGGGGGGCKPYCHVKP